MRLASHLGQTLNYLLSGQAGLHEAELDLWNAYFEIYPPAHPWKQTQAIVDACLYGPHQPEKYDWSHYCPVQAPKGTRAKQLGAFFKGIGKRKAKP